MASSSSRLSGLLASNAEFAKTWPVPPQMQHMRNSDAERILVLTCMDPRVVPEQFLGPNPRLAVFRNAGGRVSTDVVRTVTVLRSLVRSAKGTMVMVVHHTDCGMTHLTDEEIKHNVRATTEHGDKLVEGMDFGLFSAEDLEKTIISDVSALKAEPLLEGVDVRGYVLETETGLLRAVQD